MKPSVFNEGFGKNVTPVAYLAMVARWHRDVHCVDDRIAMRSRKVDRCGIRKASILSVQPRTHLPPPSSVLHPLHPFCPPSSPSSPSTSSSSILSILLSMVLLLLQHILLRRAQLCQTMMLCGSGGRCSICADVSSDDGKCNLRERCSHV